MGQEALPFGTPSEPGADPLADAIERALAEAGLDDGGAADAAWLAADGPTPTSAEAGDASGVDDAADGD
ncbi:hypothetical protein [Agrococcus jejuensis]|uniref:Uncharacterized protein n=1 Tax=Agrococcus jejuensis TaxID=399736 RepID=A0A1G8DWI5_9MICO|nr:hypothetical protein [Agrococcus jejuensis]SDH61965.1 hypothetical protein SAMN04489720_1801 [Agrococcus jejuensis]